MKIGVMSRQAGLPLNRSPRWRTCPASEGKKFFFNALDGFATDLDGAG